MRWPLSLVVFILGHIAFNADFQRQFDELKFQKNLRRPLVSRMPIKPNASSFRRRPFDERHLAESLV